VNELLFKKYFGTGPVTPLHNLYRSKPTFTRPKDRWTGGWLSACVRSSFFKFPNFILNPSAVLLYKFTGNHLPKQQCKGQINVKTKMGLRPIHLTHNCLSPIISYHQTVTIDK